MISCTEFIPAYSELFSFLEERHGRDEVDRFWTYLFKPDGQGIPLVNFVKKEGILSGCPPLVYIISSAYRTVSMASAAYLSAPIIWEYCSVSTAPPTTVLHQGAFSRRSRMVSSMAGTVVVIRALRPHRGA